MSKNIPALLSLILALNGSIAFATITNQFECASKDAEDSGSYSSSKHVITLSDEVVKNTFSKTAVVYIKTATQAVGGPIVYRYQKVAELVEKETKSYDPSVYKSEKLDNGTDSKLQHWSLYYVFSFLKKDGKIVSTAITKQSIIEGNVPTNVGNSTYLCYETAISPITID